MCWKLRNFFQTFSILTLLWPHKITLKYREKGVHWSFNKIVLCDITYPIKILQYWKKVWEIFSTYITTRCYPCLMHGGCTGKIPWKLCNRNHKALNFPLLFSDFLSPSRFEKSMGRWMRHGKMDSCFVGPALWDWDLEISELKDDSPWRSLPIKNIKWRCIVYAS